MVHTLCWFGNRWYTTIRAHPNSTKRYDFTAIFRRTATKSAEFPSENDSNTATVIISFSNWSEKGIFFFLSFTPNIFATRLLLWKTPAIRPVRRLNFQRIRTGTSEDAGIFSIRFTGVRFVYEPYGRVGIPFDFSIENGILTVERLPTRSPKIIV